MPPALRSGRLSLYDYSSVFFFGCIGSALSRRFKGKPI
jgi:hypothetical protein